MRFFSLLLFLLLVVLSIDAQFKLSAEYRARSEYKDGLKKLSDETTKPAFVTSQRTRLNMDYQSDKLAVYLSVQDVRVWGEIPHKTDVPSIALHQAYAKYHINNEFAIKLGRQMLTYDNKYLLGAKNWNNVSVAHDVALVQFKSDDTEVHAGFAYNNETDVLFETNYDVNYYKYLGLLWFRQKLSNKLSVSLLNYYEGRQKDESISTIYTRGTLGPFINFNSELLGFTLASYYQFGKSQEGDKVSAYFIHFEPSIAINKKLKIGIGVDYMSGDDATNDNGKANTFSNPYGDGHAYYGLMDYFTNIEKNTNNGGLNDLFFKATFKPSKAMTLYAAFHQFKLANNIIDSDTGLVPDKKLGNEIDLYWKYKFYSNSTLIVGYSSMFATKTMEVLKGGDSNKMQHWIYASVQFKPTIFSSSK